ncbi:apolipoprotein N-acyltransferase [Sphingomonas panacis]|uniref:Apolipoprotein N-acyltransferase n=1 Tax=Sphingomonas panacis TaxID=1560345 RepID=A0A1B3ZG59_9SPHN|nr:apolipoprotein N-acyltransferase [Sphingomonas panacis]AOH86420.1 apolipoprotein N-acyltransferase [Sphingomonas panacis]
MVRRPALPCLLLGGLAVLGFAPWGWWPVTLACFAAWLWLVHAAPTIRAALWRGWLFGVAHFTFGNIWIAEAFSYQDAVPHWLGPVAPFLLALFLAIYPMLAAGVAWRFRRAQPDAAYVLVFAAAWIVTEYLRGTLLTGYPWNPLAEIYVGSGFPPAMLLLPLLGTYAVSGISIWLAGVFILSVERSRAVAIRRAIIFGLIGAGSSLAYDWQVDDSSAPTESTAPRVRIVQPDLDQEQRPRDDYPQANLRALQTLGGTPGAAPRLILWPEGALRFNVEDGYPPQYNYLADPADVRAVIAAPLGPNDVLLTGGQALEFDAAEKLVSAGNSIFAIDARARLIGRYDKAHLVPWGEYLPARPLMSAIGLSRLVPGDIDFAPGTRPRTLTLPHFGKAGFQICYEIIFSGNVVDPKHRPDFIFNPSNDSWYSRSGPEQNLAQARLRAIEEGLPVLRATPTGVSAIIDAHGRVLASIPWNTRGAVEAPLPPPLAPTLFAKLGNWMAALVAAAMLLLAVAFRWSRR